MPVIYKRRSRGKRTTSIYFPRFSRRLQVVQLLLGMLLRIIARIGILQSRLVSPRNFSQNSSRVGSTIAGILVVLIPLIALVALAGALGAVLLLAVEDVTGMFLGFLRGIGVVEVGFVASGLTIIRHV